MMGHWGQKIIACILCMVICYGAQAMDFETKQAASEEAGATLPELIDENNTHGLIEYIKLYSVDPNQHMQLTRYEEGALHKKQAPLLIYALEMKRPKIALVLLDLGADANGTDSEGVCALQYARKQGYADVVEKLIQRGASSFMQAQRELEPKIQKILNGRRARLAQETIEASTGTGAKDITGIIGEYL